LVGELSSASGGHGQANGMASTSGFGKFEDSSIEAQAKKMGIPVEMLKEELEMQKQAAPSMKEAAVVAKPTSPKRKTKNPLPLKDPPATAATKEEEKPWTKATSKASAGGTVTDALPDGMNTDGNSRSTHKKRPTRKEDVVTDVAPETIPLIAAKTFEAGQKVECRYMGMDAYYPGTVQKVDGGKYDVLYDDGGFEGGVEGILIRNLVGELSSASGGHGQANGMASTSGFGKFEDSSIEAQAKKMGIPVEMLKEELEMQKQAAPSMKEAAVVAKPTSPKRKTKNPLPLKDPPATATTKEEEKPWTKATSKVSAGKGLAGGTATAAGYDDMPEQGVVNRF
jgi:hypothetical protein